MLLIQDHHTRRVYRLHNLSKAQLIRPKVAHCVAGNVNSADKLYLVIESIRLATLRRRASTTPIGPSASSPAASAPVWIDAGTATHHPVKTNLPAGPLMEFSQLARLALRER